MNSDSEEKAVRAVIQSSGCSHQHQHCKKKRKKERKEPCWRSFLLHNMLLGALQHLTHYEHGVCVCIWCICVCRTATVNDDTHVTFAAWISFAFKESKNGASLTLCATCLALAKKNPSGLLCCSFSANRANSPGVSGSHRWWNEWKASGSCFVLS